MVEWFKALVFKYKFKKVYKISKSIDRQQQEQLTELKEQLAALEGGKIVDIN